MLACTVPQSRQGLQAATPFRSADRNELSICLKSYLRFHPGAYYLREGLRRRMVALQAQVRVSAHASCFRPICRAQPS